MNKIFSLETEALPPDIGVGRLAILPNPVTLLPREKPLPKPKDETRWDKFAKLKGINKRKRTKLIYEEESGEYKRRWGYKRANDPAKTDQWLIEAKASDKTGDDPWAVLKKEKKERVADTEKKRQKNVNAAGARGSKHRLPGAIDLTQAMPVKKSKSTKKNETQDSNTKKKKPKQHVDVALRLAQISTASMGKFDSQRTNEPQRPKLKKRNYKLPMRKRKVAKQQEI